MKDMPNTLAYYASYGTITNPGKYEAQLKQLPADIGELMKIVQGLVIHQYVSADFYDFAIPEDRLRESHIRTVEAMLDRIFELSPEPLTTPRPPEKRLIGVCRHFIVLMLAMLRAHGIAARDRRGFGDYFNPGFYEDHITCEYWDKTDKKWKMADVQFDDVWVKQLHITHDIHDVPREHFLYSSEMWQRCRNGKVDDTKVGIFKGDFRGLWFVAGTLVREAASLNKMEMLPWDTWGAIPRPDQQRLSDEQLAFFDNLATLTSQPDKHFEDLQALYKKDARLRVPDTVFNGVLLKQEAVKD